MSNASRLTVIIQGGDHAGKGNLMAFLAHRLQEEGIPTTVQLAESHNREKLESDDSKLLERLQSCEVVLMEQRT